MGFSMDGKDFTAFPFTADLYTALKIRTRNFVLLQLCDGAIRKERKSPRPFAARSRCIAFLQSYNTRGLRERTECDFDTSLYAVINSPCDKYRDTP